MLRTANPLAPVTPVTVDNTAGGVSLGTVPGTAKTALIQNNGAEIRIRVDGGAPTTVVGFLVADGDTIEFFDDDYETSLRNFRAIRTGAVSSTLTIQYFD